MAYEMKGQIWFNWITVMVAMFVITVIWLIATPFLTAFKDATYSTSFDDVGTNASYHLTQDYNFNIWNAWPLAAVFLAFAIIIIAANNEDRARGGWV